MNLAHNLNKYLDEMVTNIAGIVSVTVVSTRDGNVIGYKSQNSDIDNRLSASFQIEVMRQVSRGMNYVDNLRSRDVKDLIVNLEEQVHLVFTSKSKEYIIHIIANTKNASEGLVRMMHNKYSSLID